MSFPCLDANGIQRRSFLRPSIFNEVEGQSPGFTVQSIATQTSYVYSRLRKRYGKHLPFGQAAPALVPAGSWPPSVVLTGRPTLGCYLMVLQITTGGPMGTAIFRWSSDGGITYAPSATNVPTAPTVVLATTGMSAVFPVGTYDISQSYAAAPPVPEAILRWVTILVSADVFRRHGVNPNDPMMIGLTEEVKVVRAEIEEAANSQTGLFDLPSSEDEQSAVSTGGPRSYSEASPYTWTYRQEEAASRELDLVVGTPNRLVGR
jgi:hypothetical protein